MGKKYEKKVRWDFKVAFHGYGRTCKEALVDAAQHLEHQCEFDFAQSDFDAIENYETQNVSENDFVGDDET